MNQNRPYFAFKVHKMSAGVQRHDFGWICSFEHRTTSKRVLNTTTLCNCFCGSVAALAGRVCSATWWRKELRLPSHTASIFGVGFPSDQTTSRKDPSSHYTNILSRPSDTSPQEQKRFASQSKFLSSASNVCCLLWGAKNSEFRWFRLWTPANTLCTLNAWFCYTLSWPAS